MSGRQNNPLFWQNEQKVPPPITKSIRHVQCCATDELYFLVACNLYQNEEEGYTFHFYAEISEEKIHNFLQSTIKNQQKGCYLMSRSTPSTLCLSTRSAPSTLFLNAQSSQGTLIKLYEFLKHSGTQIKSTWSAPGPQKKSTRCAPRHQITSFLLIFNCQL